MKKYGNSFYALVFDFKSYFDSIPHKTCYKVLKDNFTDDRIVNLVMSIILSYHEPDILNIPDARLREEKLKELLNIKVLFSVK